MDNESANYYTREVMVILIREFQSPDEEMKKIVLKVREGEEARGGVRVGGELEHSMQVRTLNFE